MREYDSHAPGFGSHRAKHVLNPGIVATCPRWHTDNITTIGVSEPEVFAPMFQRKGWICDDAIKSGEKVSIEKGWLAQSITTNDLEIFDAVQKRLIRAMPEV